MPAGANDGECLLAALTGGHGQQQHPPREQPAGQMQQQEGKSGTAQDAQPHVSCPDDGIGAEDGGSGVPRVVEVLSRLRGPWAVLFWEAGSRRLWMGRDILGEPGRVHVYLIRERDVSLGDQPRWSTTSQAAPVASQLAAHTSILHTVSQRTCGKSG